jgi:hypothetical protein
MLPVSLGCTFLLPLRYSLTFICPVSCVPYVSSFSGLLFFITLSVFSNIYLSCVLSTQSWIWIVLFFITPSVFSKIYLSCVLCTLCCQFLWIVLVYSPVGILQHLFVMCLLYPMLPVSLDCPFSLPLRYSLTFICPVSCVPYVASFSGLYFSLLPLRYSLTGICTVSCVSYVASFSGLFFFIAPSVFSNIYLSCVLCTLCCQLLWIVLVYNPVGII